MYDIDYVSRERSDDTGALQTNDTKSYNTRKQEQNDGGAPASITSPDAELALEPAIWERCCC